MGDLISPVDEDRDGGRKLFLGLIPYIIIEVVRGRIANYTTQRITKS